MKDVRRWPRFRVTIELDIAAPCGDAAEELAQEYVTQATNDNGEDREPYTHESWSAVYTAKHGPTDPAYVVQAQHRGAKESR